MTRRELKEHLGYWRDPIKRSRYLAALRERVTPDSVVLDMGAGTGLLGLLALKAGADRVIAVEQGEIIGPARQIAAANGLADRIEFLKGHSSALDLPKVDLVVCDQIGGLVHDAGVLHMYQDLVSRSVVAADALVPGSFELVLAPVEAPRPHSLISQWTDDEFDLSVMAKLAANTEHRVPAARTTRLAPGVAFDQRRAHETGPIKTRLEFVTERDGTIHGFAGWFHARLSPSVTISNAPDDPDRMDRWLNFYPLPEPIQIDAGESVAVDLAIDPASSVTSWRATVGDRTLEQQSTFHGTFRSSETLGFGGG